MTLTEKILARAAGKARVQAGDNVWVKADILMTHDVCGPGTIGVFKREFGETAKVWDANKVVIIPDHYILQPTGSTSILSPLMPSLMYVSFTQLEVTRISGRAFS